MIRAPNSDHKNLPWVLAIGVFVGVAISWAPGILWERALFRELEPSSVPKADLDKAIARAVAPSTQMTDGDRKVCLQNMDLLLRLPVLQGEPNDREIKYRYSTLSERVGLKRIPLFFFILLLSFVSGLAFFVVARKPWTADYRHMQFLFLALSIFVLGGLLPYSLSAGKAGGLAIVGFYAALFTWIYGLRIDDPKETFELGKAAPSAERLNVIYSYYMRLLAFSFAIFGGVTIALMLHVSRTIGETYALGTSLKHDLFLWLILNDFYGSMILFVGVVGRLVQMVVEAIRLYPKPK